MNTDTNETSRPIEPDASQPSTLSEKTIKSTTSSSSSTRRLSCIKDYSTKQETSSRRASLSHRKITPKRPNGRLSLPSFHAFNKSLSDAEKAAQLDEL